MLRLQKDDTVTISTHALLAEGDGSGSDAIKVVTDFNPRPPCGGRHEDGDLPF